MLEKHIRLVWWLTSFAAANGSWFLIAEISLKNVPLPRESQFFVDTAFMTSLGLVALATLLALWATFATGEKRRGFFVQAWFGYLVLYVLCAMTTVLYWPAPVTA